MSFSWIGNLSFITMTGDIFPTGPVVEAVQRPGIDGTMWRSFGSKGREFSVLTLAFYSTSADAQAYRINYTQSVGLDLILVDPTGAQWGVYVEGAMPSMPKLILQSTYGAGYLVECEWHLRVTGW